jgi:RNA polymerase sigma-70 factor (family 1)
LCSFANKYVNNIGEAEDTTQEVFIQVWEQREKFENISHIKSFLYLSVKNKCLNYLKHKAVQEKHIQLTLYNAMDELFFTDHLVQAEVALHIKNTVGGLSAQRKKIIELGLEGLPNEEIARLLNISLNTLKMQKKIAYRQLREKLKPTLFVLLFL